MTNPVRNSDTGTRDASVATSLRAGLSRVVWLICVLCALVLAFGALLIALGAPPSNAGVELVLHAGDLLDLGVFSRDGAVHVFEGPDAETRNSLVNWGVAAIGWLILGRILDRIIAP